jgi:hypothetical protein
VRQKIKKKASLPLWKRECRSLGIDEIFTTKTQSSQRREKEKKLRGNGEIREREKNIFKNFFPSPFLPFLLFFFVSFVPLW